MPPTHVQQMRKGIATKPVRTKRAQSASRDVWFYAAEASSESPPSRKAMPQIITTDSQRLSKSPWPYARQRRPKSKRLRCTLCLREMDEWMTWDNSNEESSWQKFYDHLRSVHSITCRPLREPEVPGFSGRFVSSGDEAQESSADESVYPKLISKTTPATSATTQSKPPQPQGRSLPAPSTSSRNHVRSVPKRPYKAPVVEDSDEDETDSSEYSDEDDTDRSERVNRTTDEELDYIAEMSAQGLINYSESDDVGPLEDFRSARFGARVPMNLKTKVKMLEVKLDRVTQERRRVTSKCERVTAECKRVTAERDRVVAQRDKIAGERDRAIAERDREAKSRRLLKEEVVCLKEAARAREEELLELARSGATST